MKKKIQNKISHWCFWNKKKIKKTVCRNYLLPPDSETLAGFRYSECPFFSWLSTHPAILMLAIVLSHPNIMSGVVTASAQCDAAHIKTSYLLTAVDLTPVALAAPCLPLLFLLAWMDAAHGLCIYYPRNIWCLLACWRIRPSLLGLTGVWPASKHTVCLLAVGPSMRACAHTHMQTHTI